MDDLTANVARDRIAELTENLTRPRFHVHCGETHVPGPCRDGVTRTAMPRIRAYHPASGSILTAEVTDEQGEAPTRWFRVIPDGLLEAVIIREGVWVVTDV